MKNRILSLLLALALCLGLSTAALAAEGGLPFAVGGTTAVSRDGCTFTLSRPVVGEVPAVRWEYFETDGGVRTRGTWAPKGTFYLVPSGTTVTCTEADGTPDVLVGAQSASWGKAFQDERSTFVVEDAPVILLAAGLDVRLCPIGGKTAAFTDFAAGDYFFQSMDWAVTRGITTGTTDSTFSPNKPCTTAEILTFLWRAAGQASGADGGPYYGPALLWAAEVGIEAADADPSAPCTRAKAVEYLWKTAGSPTANSTAVFTDIPAGAAYAEAAAWAAETGVTSGTGDSIFSPDKICTRAEIVTFLFRAFSETEAPSF